MKYEVKDLVTIVDIITDNMVEKEFYFKYIGRVGEIVNIFTNSIWPYDVKVWKLADIEEETIAFKEEEIRLQ